MNKIISQATLICLISFVVAITFNQFSASPLPILKPYQPAVLDELEQIKDDNGIPISQHVQDMDGELFKVLLENGEVVPVDARSEVEFKHKHIPNAVNVPVIRFQDKYGEKKELLKGKKILVCYCSSEDCSDARLLAVKLYLQGHTDVFVLTGGIETWEAEGNPVRGNQL
jgi:rhodanese-related sulfurtransferase